MKRTGILVAIVAILVAALSGVAVAAGEPLSPLALLTGTDGPDRLEGTANPDTINAFAGNDRAFGRGSGDVVRGGTGRDTISGGSGNDALYGGGGNDFIDARTVNGDPANVERGEDKVYCGTGSDDQVVANRFDFVASDCEHVSRSGRDGG